MEKEKIELHSNDSCGKSAKLIRDANLRLLQLGEIKHKSKEANRICKIQLKKIKQDFSSLVLKFEKIIEEEEEGNEVSGQFRTDIGKLNLDEMKHAHDIIHQLNCHIGMLPIDFSAVPARINSF